ncbi:hypothetical protein BJ978_003138 [Agromyces terreus]|uniref:Uncharacterized protein n=1 Tax=Agromyces terreus TaxID=424795 RepID=A0A9X2KG45_9MICO|nr:hypothetical protein [Agromyces terreus]MCP2372462.1 hypothetical protein [Agromyces terreus]
MSATTVLLSAPIGIASLVGSEDQEFDPNTVTPGVWGFVITFGVMIAVTLLVIDMTRRIRRTNYRAEVREELAREMAENERIDAERAASDRPGADRPGGDGSGADGRDGGATDASGRSDGDETARGD